ncbi:hypothetical protein [Pseudoalteromonas luteoviolacea]|uniref:Uncharacterized protein n=1 Tax=Pseudoalteromonas luteoviolacea DSM 6061 TaxID=1365250 RepID=A0A166YYA1_9GAMM|nr:hypothetical protein [Pseudoalteromonas luteoviolacea]KZN43626.1 hypothetical protein N475_08635 [Pseudoalteromonas luteoviolacea DSM 6061]KZN53697.1 hypothetical protein N474_20405 [Pseudoalteromonas luteoviolacea CPMOR-2]MBE0386490.1 hypothetical protein [Pseudoalteromonas luteoviolacea DSM 6061]TQF71361.1 hypothetical protein FLM44_09805 [Pseudoalteromonas luteoviolacea]
MTNQAYQIQQFIELSGALTDFNAFTLNGTGQVQNYYDTLNRIVGRVMVEELLSKFSAIYEASTDHEKFNELLRKQIIGDEKFGPVARNIIKLWYTGMWYQMAQFWREAYGMSDEDVTFFVNSASYAEGLLWQAIDANPSGAKGPGYGSWSLPPNINFDNCWQFKPFNHTS